MKITLSLLLLLLNSCNFSVKGQTLESIPSHSVLHSIGGSFTISCKALGYNFGDYGMSWIRQPSGKALQWIGHINTESGATSYAKGLEGRIEITKDNSKGISYLKLSDLRVEDTALYHCAV
uniref:Ig-like domain-containing protein n=1 Tax=Astyanax mexicanus TaxID=7994 RepID=A0A3B1KHU2_ASTMX